MEERETFLELERGIEDFLMGFLKKAKYIVFGPEPVLAYGLAKKRELRLVRLLGIGKVNQIPVDLLKERISETYV
jgi:V/A-type H+-transporting ATPase subunit C